MFLKDYLLDIKTKKNTPLFLRAEQGSGKHETDIFVIYSLRMRNLVHNWLNNEYSNIVKDSLIMAPPSR